jgi:hypothetical protein
MCPYFTYFTILIFKGAEIKCQLKEIEKVTTIPASVSTCARSDDRMCKYREMILGLLRKIN